MLQHLSLRIHQDRRRLLVVITLAFLSGLIVASVIGANPWLIASIYAVVVGTCATLICLLRPSMRFMVEAVALSRLCMTLAVAALPSAAALLLGNPFTSAAITVLGGIAISRAIHGRLVKNRGAGWHDCFVRKPARVVAGPRQARFTAWIDGGAPVTA